MLGALAYAWPVGRMSLAWLLLPLGSPWVVVCNQPGEGAAWSGSYRLPVVRLALALGFLAVRLLEVRPCVPGGWGYWSDQHPTF